MEKWKEKNRKGRFWGRATRKTSKSGTREGKGKSRPKKELGNFSRVRRQKGLRKKKRNL